MLPQLPQGAWPELKASAVVGSVCFLQKHLWLWCAQRASAKLTSAPSLQGDSQRLAAGCVESSCQAVVTDEGGRRGRQLWRLLVLRLGNLPRTGQPLLVVGLLPEPDQPTYPRTS